MCDDLLLPSLLKHQDPVPSVCVLLFLRTICRAMAQGSGSWDAVLSDMVLGDNWAAVLQLSAPRESPAEPSVGEPFVVESQSADTWGEVLQMSSQSADTRGEAAGDSVTEGSAPHRRGRGRPRGNREFNVLLKDLRASARESARELAGAPSLQQIKEDRARKARETREARALLAQARKQQAVAPAIEIDAKCTPEGILSIASKRDHDLAAQVLALGFVELYGLEKSKANKDLAFDSQDRSIANRLCGPNLSKRAITSQSAEAEILDITIPRLARSYRSLACALVCGSLASESHLVKYLVNAVSNGFLEPFLLVWRVRYDETPMPSTCLHSDGPSKASGIAKILQSEVEWLAVFRCDDGNPYGYFALRSGRPTWLQLLERCTGEVLKAAVRDVASVPESFDIMFPRKVRQVTTDAYSANIRAESAVGRELSPAGWVLLHLFCDVHKIHTVAGRMWKLVDGDISAVISLAISTNQLGDFSKFRSLLKAYIKEKLVVIKDSCPDEEANRYRRGVLALFLDTENRDLNITQRKLRAAALPLVANGDWRKHGIVEHYFIPGTSPPLSILPDVIAIVMCWCLLPVALKVFHRDRWAGADIPLDDLGLAEHCHGLLSGVYPQMRGGNRNSGGGEQALADEEAPIDKQDDEEAPVDKPQDPTANNMREDLQQMRVSSINWAEGKPGGRLAIMRICMEPHRLFMIRSFANGMGDSGDRRASGLVPHLVSGSGLEKWRQNYKICLAAARKHSLQMQSDIAELMGGKGHWFLLQGGNRTNVASLLAFRLLSRSSAVCHYLISMRHKNYPFKLFHYFAESDAELKIAMESEIKLDANCPHRLDVYSADYVRVYGDDLESEEAQVEAESVAQMAETDISLLEAGAFKHLLPTHPPTHLQGRSPTHSPTGAFKHHLATHPRRFLNRPPARPPAPIWTCVAPSTYGKSFAFPFVVVIVIV